MSDEPRIMVVGGANRGGRPTAAVKKSHRTFYLPTAYIDRIDQMALRAGVSSNEQLKEILDLALRMKPGFRTK